MNSKLLFLAGCIPARLLLAYIAYYSFNIDSKHSNTIKYILTIITFLIGVSFIVIYEKGWRKTGLETGGKEIWWNDYRPIHGSIYLIFSFLSLIYIINPSYSFLKYIWLLLLLDVIIGIIVFSKHYKIL
jgi:hypothetical protein